MKVLAFAGSPRKGGNSDVLLDAFLDGCTRAGAEIVRYRLFDHTIQPCIGCGGCDQTGVCVVKDDMHLFYDALRQASRIVIASPIYFYGVTAQTKAFIDRLQALWSERQLKTKAGTWVKDDSRRGVFLSVAATQGEKVFDGAILSVRYAFDAIGMRYGGELTVRGIDRRGDLKTRPEILEQAVGAGQRFVTQGGAAT